MDAETGKSTLFTGVALKEAQKAGTVITANAFRQRKSKLKRKLPAENNAPQLSQQNETIIQDSQKKQKTNHASALRQCGLFQVSSVPLSVVQSEATPANPQVFSTRYPGLY